MPNEKSQTVATMESAFGSLFHLLVGIVLGPLSLLVSPFTRGKSFESIALPESVRNSKPLGNGRIIGSRDPKVAAKIFFLSILLAMFLLKAPLSWTFAAAIVFYFIYFAIAVRWKD